MMFALLLYPLAFLLGFRARRRRLRGGHILVDGIIIIVDVSRRGNRLRSRVSLGGRMRINWHRIIGMGWMGRCRREIVHVPKFIRGFSRGLEVIARRGMAMCHDRSGLGVCVIAIHICS
jgi:hypothetical protein